MEASAAQVAAAARITLTPTRPTQKPHFSQRDLRVCSRSAASTDPRYVRTTTLLVDADSRIYILNAKEGKLINIGVFTPYGDDDSRNIQFCRDADIRPGST